MTGKCFQSRGKPHKIMEKPFFPIVVAVLCEIERFLVGTKWKPWQDSNSTSSQHLTTNSIWWRGKNYGLSGLAGAFHNFEMKGGK